MTRNQIEYWRLKETQRNNQAVEREQHRANLARETETHRANLAQEKETNRANLAREDETHRSNLVNEKERERSNRAAEFQARINSDRNFFLTLRAQNETERANKANEQLTRARVANERLTAETNAAVSQLQQYVRAAEVQLKQRQLDHQIKQDQVLASQNWVRLAESKRSNLMNEQNYLVNVRETARSNAANESIRQRQVQLQNRQQLETERHNAVTESEQHRKNTLDEVIAQQRLGLDAIKTALQPIRITSMKGVK